TPRPIAPLQHERPLSDAEVHLLWARLRRWQGPGATAARIDLDEALARDPGSAEVQYWRGLFAAKQGQHAEAERALTLAVETSPAEPRYLLGLATFYRSKGRRDRLAAVASQLASLARSPQELSFLGRYYADTARPDEGLSFAERAVKADPTCWGCF